jgi:dolichol-phosphate mannosyltransferase
MAVSEEESHHDPATPAATILDVNKLYQHRFPALVKQQKERVWKVMVSRFFQPWIPTTDIIVDLGCGYGEFLNHIQGGRRIGVDFNSDAPGHLSAGIEFHQGDVTDLQFLDDDSVDTIFTSNMLEHLESKAHVERLVIEAYRVLKPDGQFIAMGPNMRFLPGLYWDFWDHIVAITDRSLVELLEYTGFTIERVYPKFLPYTTQSKYPQNAFLVGLYLKFPPAWSVLGKQFLIRARKK